MNTFDLTCQKTHILAWLNSDDTLSLKINGVKYFASSRTDKRGGKYWKLDGLVSNEAPNSVPTSLSQEELKLVKSYQKKAANGLPGLAFSNAEEQAYQKYQVESQKKNETISNQ